MKERHPNDIAYLGLVGHDIPFHDSALFLRYTQAMREVLSVAFDSTLDSALVDVIRLSKMHKVVAEYLLRQSEREVLVSPAGSVPQRAAALDVASRELLDLMTQMIDFEASAPLSEPSARRGQQSGDDSARTRQLNLFLADAGAKPLGLGGVNVESIVPPPSDEFRRIGTSEAVPLIFAAMVRLAARGNASPRGIDITHEINTFITDGRRKEPTNISRALRGSALRTQRWFTVEGRLRAYTFRLSDAWRESWQEIFRVAPPNMPEL